MFLRLTSTAVAWLFILLFTLLLATACAEKRTQENPPLANNTAASFTIYKSPSCGCCGLWVEHLESHEFHTQIEHSSDLNAVKKQLGIAPEYQSCHTVLSQEGYVFEGHIPARFIQQFLDNPPKDALGLAVPGMPLGSPGMEMGERFTPYDIYLLKKEGDQDVFAHVAKAEEQH